MNTHFSKTFPVTAHTDYVAPGSAFIAIPGTKHNGINYIPLALQKGAKTIIVQHDQNITSDIHRAIDDADAFLVTVPNARQALAEFSLQAHGFPASKLKIIGITGTKGKTTTAFTLEHILKAAGHKTALLTTVHNKINNTVYKSPLTTPQPDYLHAFFAQCVAQEVEYVVMEVSAQAVSMHRIDGISFNAVIFTNFSQEHAEFYDSQDQYFAAKAEFLDRVKPNGFCVLNVDDSEVQSLLLGRENAIAISCEHPTTPKASKGRRGADYYARMIKTNLSGTTFELSYGNSDMSLSTLEESFDSALLHSGRAGKKVVLPLVVSEADRRSRIHSSEGHQIKKNTTSLEFETLLVGKFNLYNVLSAIAVAHRLKIDLFVIYNALAAIPPIPGRMERYELSNGVQCIIDYAHTPSSYTALLSLLRKQTDNLIVVFGCGGARDSSKRPEMGRIASEMANLIILTSDNPRSEDPQMIIDDIAVGVASGNQHKIVQELDREMAIKKAHGFAKKGTIIAILGKGPDEYQVVGGHVIPFSERQILREL